MTKDPQQKKRSTSVWLWVLSFVITVALGYFQRTTGPTYPLRGSASVGGTDITYRLPRTHGGEGGLTVALPARNLERAVELEWRRFPTAEPWQRIPMAAGASSGALEAEIPHQPPAGKVEYRIVLTHGGGEVHIPEGQTVVARFRSDVPASVLIPHILAMFTSMLLATRALFEVCRRAHSNSRGHVLTAMALLLVGGMLLGPIVQKFAFGAYWTGWPFGTDLTDNKTLIAVLAWLPATFFALVRRPNRIAVVVGWVVMMGVFLIPHSLHGSEIDWSDTESTVTAPQP